MAAVGEAFSYATDPAAGLEGLAERLESIYRALAPGGLLLFDVAGPGRSGSTGSRERCFPLDVGLLRIEEHENRAAHSLERRIVVYTPLGRLFRRSEEVHRLTLYEPEALAALLSEIGFAWQPLACYHETPFPPGLYGFAASKQK